MQYMCLYTCSISIITHVRVCVAAVISTVQRPHCLRSLGPGDHWSGKSGNVKEFDSCQGNVREFTKNQGNVWGKILSGKKCLILLIVSCIFASVQVFSTSTGMIWVTLNMPSAAEECRELSWQCQGISRCLESGHPVGRPCLNVVTVLLNSRRGHKPVLLGRGSGGLYINVLEASHSVMQYRWSAHYPQRCRGRINYGKNQGRI